MTVNKQIVTQLLKSIDVNINGLKPWDIQVHNEEFYHRVVKKGDLGLGESYVDGQWDCEKLDELFERLTKAKLSDLAQKQPKFWALALKIMGLSLVSELVNFQKLSSTRNAIKKHYELGNDLYESFLDASMQYSCGYWQNSTDLDHAQINKMELICEKLDISPGMKILDIGCGWGGLARYIAERYDVKVYGINICEKQLVYAKDLCKELPITFLSIDYRDLVNLRTKFDRVISVGMFEHLGPKNYTSFMSVVYQVLKPDGLFLLHTIGSQKSTNMCGSLWLNKYIFSHGVLPSLAQISKATEGKFVTEDIHNFGAFYDQTLLSWYDNFCNHWPKLKNKYDDRFFRIWVYYLNSCAGAFRSRYLQLWQIVLSPEGIKGGYKRIGEKKFKGSN